METIVIDGVPIFRLDNKELEKIRKKMVYGIHLTRNDKIVKCSSKVKPCLYLEVYMLILYTVPYKNYPRFACGTSDN